jgi:hypothetical protein
MITDRSESDAHQVLSAGMIVHVWHGVHGTTERMDLMVASALPERKVRRCSVGHPDDLLRECTWLDTPVALRVVASTQIQR